MNAYVNDYNSKLDLKNQNSSRTDKLKLKINLGKIKEKETELASDRNLQLIEDLKKENARLIDRQAKEIK
jgi:dihydroneopterin aldolase